MELPQPIVRVEHAHYRYPGADAEALRDVSLEIKARSCCALLGPNGAGKTTLISLLTGALATQRGDVTIAGHSLACDAKAIKAVSALVPQEYAFYPTLTGLQNLQFFAGIYRVPKHALAQRISFCSDTCGLGNILRRPAHSYSGGNKRRLNIAIGLLNNPQILYLDEPTVGVDARSRQLILDTIQRLNKSGMTIIYSSHYMEEIEKICSDVAIINAGRVVLQSSLAELVNGSSHLQIQPAQIPTNTVVDALYCDHALRWDDGHFCLDYDATSPLSTLLASIENTGLDIASITMRQPRLEDIYLRLTEKNSESVTCN